jgi:hypothetical protein
MDARPLKRSARTLLLALVVAASGACAASTAESPFGSAAGGDPQGATIIVDNENAAFSDLTIYLVPRNGVRRRLGTVSLNQTRTFRVDRIDWSGDVRLLADPVGGRDFVSRSFVLTRGDVVEWDLGVNNVRYQGRGGR